MPEASTIIQATGIAHPRIQPSISSSASTKDELYADLAVPAGSKTIRLLDLQLVTRQLDDAPLTGSLRVVNLQDKPEFTALSYAWKDSDDEEENRRGETNSQVRSPTLGVATTADGQVDLDITPSCFDALRHIRRHQSKAAAVTSGPRALSIWIDAVCINQQDDHDKTGQIPLMQEIYSQASTCYVWLGKSSPELDKAINHFRWGTRYYSRLPLVYINAPTQAHRKIELKRLQKRMWQDMQARLFCFLYPKRKLDLEKLVKCRWVHRAWTFQELLLSENPVFLCGDNLLLWEDIVQAAVFETPFEPWLPLVELWLGLPRRPRNNTPLGQSSSISHYRDDLEATASSSPPDHSFQKLLYDYEDKQRVSGEDKVTPRINLVFVRIGQMAVLLITGSLLYLAVSFFSTRLSERKTIGVPMIVSFVLFCVLVLPFTGFWLKSAFSWLRFVCDGKENSLWMDQLKRQIKEGSRKNHALFLNGIWTALCERESVEPRDKAFSLYGILASNKIGSPESWQQPDYKQPLMNIYLNLFERLLSWDPISATLIISGRGISQEAEQNGTSQESWPSWLPDWTAPERNAWMVSRFRLEDSHSATKHPPFTQPPSISGNSLKIQGQYIGTVTSPPFRFDPIPLSSLPEIITSVESLPSSLLAALGTLVRWMYSVDRLMDTGSHGERPYDLHQRGIITGTLFAILQGAYPSQRPDDYFIVYAGRYRGRRTGEEIPKFTVPDSWKNPYDFTLVKNRFLLFEDFWSVVKRVCDEHYQRITITQPLGVGGEEGTGQQEEDGEEAQTVERKVLDALLKEDPRAVYTRWLVEILIGTINKLASEERCLFLVAVDITGDSGTGSTTNGVTLTPSPDTPSEPPTARPGLQVQYLAGSGHLDTTTGDRVYLLSGVRTPLVLRDYNTKGKGKMSESGDYPSFDSEIAGGSRKSKKPQRLGHRAPTPAPPSSLNFRLVGPALVHGLMHGEEGRFEEVYDKRDQRYKDRQREIKQARRDGTWRERPRRFVSQSVVLW
ncbi:heterokaryon incompatibility protein-domain-containing protein [Rhypophila decipiens]|uniref:Heterokaryon incompatibility protein-domain-containing protein n=1 Tax=Rhypophila decipiens TaxID=261697 RepID=A0AAN6YEM5_9PEZI|nr:heterokaryon incompatibility protein-domain-containing protein [Rhypophila decipiens]